MGLATRGKFFKNFSTLREVANYIQMYGSTDEGVLIQKFGENRDIDTSPVEDIWSYGGTRPKPGDAELFNIVSSSTEDDVGQTGATLVLVQGLDDEYKLQEEYVVMDGTTPVATTNTFTNIHRMLAATVGSNGVNVGTITATGATSANVMAEIPADYGITQMSHYMTPVGYIGYILATTLSIYKADSGGTRQGELSLRIQIDGFSEFRTEVYGLESNTITHNFPYGLPVREKSLIWFEGLAATNNTSMAASYELLLINKDWVRNP